jgi:hypothetical protein
VRLGYEAVPTRRVWQLEGGVGAPNAKNLTSEDVRLLDVGIFVFSSRTSNVEECKLSLSLSSLGLIPFGLAYWRSSSVVLYSGSTTVRGGTESGGVNAVVVELEFAQHSRGGTVHVGDIIGNCAST